MTAHTWLSPVPPTVAVEIATRRVTVVEVAASSGAITAYAGEGLPEGAISPLLAGANVRQPDVVKGALARALERAGLTAARRVALVVPDSIARVSLLTFDQTPARPQDLDQLVRWQLRKTTPFPFEEAVVSHVPASTDGSRILIAAVLARRSVLTEYEALVSDLGMHAGVVDLASFNVMNAVMAATKPDGDWLLVHLASEATTLAILRGTSLMFYRHRTAVDEETLGALVHQTAMYHEDRLGGGNFSRVWLSGAAGAHADDARWQISGRLGVPVEAVDVRPAASVESLSAPSADVLDALAAPVGILVRDRKAG